MSRGDLVAKQWFHFFFLRQLDRRDVENLLGPHVPATVHLAASTWSAEFAMGRKRALEHQCGMPRAECVTVEEGRLFDLPPLFQGPIAEREVPAMSPEQQLEPMALTPPQLPSSGPPLQAVPRTDDQLPPDPTAHWGQICVASRMCITNMQLQVGQALTANARARIDWAHMIPELRVQLYYDVKAVRDHAIRLGQQQMFLQLAPLLKEARQQLAAEQALTQQLAEEVKHEQAGEDYKTGMTLDAVVDQYTASFDSDEDGLEDVQRRGGPTLSMDEIEELLMSSPTPSSGSVRG